MSHKSGLSTANFNHNNITALVLSSLTCRSGLFLALAQRHSPCPV